MIRLGKNPPEHRKPTAELVPRWKLLRLRETGGSFLCRVSASVTPIMFLGTYVTGKVPQEVASPSIANTPHHPHSPRSMAGVQGQHMRGLGPLLTHCPASGMSRGARCPLQAGSKACRQPPRGQGPPDCKSHYRASSAETHTAGPQELRSGVRVSAPYRQDYSVQVLRLGKAGGTSSKGATAAVRPPSSTPKWPRSGPSSATDCPLGGGPT